MKQFTKFKGFDFEKLETYEELEGFILDTSCEVHELGRDLNNYKIYGLSVGDLSKPMIFIDGAIHGWHEWRTVHWTKGFIERMNNPQNDGNLHLIEKMKSKFCFMVIPCLSRANYINLKRDNFVDLNRNFPIGWDNYVDNPEVRKGDYPISEPESQAIKSVIDTYRVFAYVNTHTWGSNVGGVIETTWTGKKYQKIYEDIHKSINLSLGVDIMQLKSRNSATTPWASEWVCSQDSKCGGNVLGVIMESGGGQPENFQAELGMTALFIISYEICEYYTTRCLM